jgi:2-keto-4-pentenoate hydratase/2-oxohepta-3-ene-1,7-dioic acid hydratase in catechol pathway
MGTSLDRLRIVVFGPRARVGAWVGDEIVDLNLAYAATLGPGAGREHVRRLAADRVPASLAGLIERGAEGLDHARSAVDHALHGAGRNDDGGASRFPVPAVRLLPPAVPRPRIGCAAGNYAEHTLGSAARKGAGESRALAGLITPGDGAGLPTAAELTERTRERGVPRGFWKDFALPSGPGDGVPYPARANLFDYEGEVAVVIGSRAKDVPAGRGGDHIWGVTLLNDWSIRGTSQKDSLSFNLSKNFDSAASIGPCIVVGDIDPADLVVETRVNGDLRQHYHSGDMIFTHAQFVEYLSRDFTLLPGDMISGGSGPGSATDAAKGDPPDTSLFLKVGDLVEVSSEPIGILSNRIVAKAE